MNLFLFRSLIFFNKICSCPYLEQIRYKNIKYYINKQILTRYFVFLRYFFSFQEYREPVFVQNCNDGFAFRRVSGTFALQEPGDDVCHFFGGEFTGRGDGVALGQMERYR